MSKTLIEIAQELKNSKKKVQLIYAFNGTGKTRLSRAFKNLINPKTIIKEDGTEEEQGSELEDKKILYFIAFTEDLFHWDNDLVGDKELKLKILPNTFTHRVFVDEGLEKNVTNVFKYYTNDKMGVFAQNPETVKR
jgi:energy-coupling factor transporter ATP-binding protein EcfA2